MLLEVITPSIPVEDSANIKFVNAAVQVLAIMSTVYQKANFLREVDADAAKALDSLKLAHFAVKTEVKLATIFRYEGLFATALLSANSNKSEAVKLARSELANMIGDKSGVSESDIQPATAALCNF